MARLPLTLSLYRLAGRLAPPVATYILRKRARRGKEDASRLGERRGYPSLPRPRGPLVWIHAASVGETISVLSLIARLTADGRHVLLTTGTVTSATLAASRLPKGAFHQYVPVDLPGATARFLGHWQPDLALFCESELWPTLMLETQRRGIPLGIINGRMSERSAKGWQRASGTIRTLLSPLAFCLAQSEADAERYRRLGAPAVNAGNIKFDAAPLPVDIAELDRLDAMIRRRPVFVAASTHPGEEAFVLETAAQLRDNEPELLTIIVPRHPQRGPEIAEMSRNGGMESGLRSRSDQPDDTRMLYIADTLGELGLFYSVATVAFLGGSLVPVGGHNPIEPAQLGAPIVHGPEIHNFAEILGAFDAADAAVKVLDSAGLAKAIAYLLQNEEARQGLIDKARMIVAANEGALIRTMAEIDALLPPRSGGLA